MISPPCFVRFDYLEILSLKEHIINKLPSNYITFSNKSKYNISPSPPYCLLLAFFNKKAILKL